MEIAQDRRGYLLTDGAPVTLKESSREAVRTRCFSWPHLIESIEHFIFMKRSKSAWGFQTSCSSFLRTLTDGSRPAMILPATPSSVIASSMPLFWSSSSTLMITSSSSVRLTLAIFCVISDSVAIAHKE